AAGAPGARAPRSRSSTATARWTSTAYAGSPTSRTSSCSSPARRSPDGSPTARPPRRPPRSRRPPGRDGPRGRELLVVLALVHVLLDRRPDHLPARLRVRLRLAREPRGGLRLRRLRRHRDRRYHGALLRLLPGAVLD